ncbi:C-reactive protein-like [Dasypus novemcinctus]|uniref:C-reactive protein-like n=1 Tax=Dasypus novemcinctus TaxID=9361 RepID=UPI000328E2D9|nr:C-reactive protein-like [Dasypus novemcinctus]
MEKLWLCFLVFISLTSAFSETDMRKKAFVFPRESADSFVTLIAHQEKPLTAFTVCLHAYTDLTRDYSLFSYATMETDNEILIFKENGGYSISVGGSDITFSPPVSSSSPAPLHLCVTWESASGIIELWLDGKPMVRKSLKKGYSLGTEASIILGQEQDSFGGSFDESQSLVGDIGNVNMWDFVLSPDQINAVYAGENFSPNVLAWQALKYEASGEVFIKPQLWP